MTTIKTELKAERTKKDDKITKEGLNGIRRLPVIPNTGNTVWIFYQRSCKEDPYLRWWLNCRTSEVPLQSWNYNSMRHTEHADKESGWLGAKHKLKVQGLGDGRNDGYHFQGETSLTDRSRREIKSSPPLLKGWNNCSQKMQVPNLLESSAPNDLMTRIFPGYRRQGHSSEESELACYQCRQKIVQNHLTFAPFHPSQRLSTVGKLPLSMNENNIHTLYFGFFTFIYFFISSSVSGGQPSVASFSL